MTSGLKAALFDLDGLLVDSEPLWHQAEIAVLGSYGVPLTVEMCRETKGRYVAEAVKHWHDRYPWDPPDFDKVVSEVLEALDELVTTRLELKAGVHHAISECKERGLRLAVASSSPLRIIAAALQRFELDDFFEVSCSAENEAAGKPDPAVFLTTARLLGAEPESCVVFEDSLAGIRAAKAAGMLCVAVPEQQLTSAEVSDDETFAAADVLLSSLEELDEHVWARLQIAPGATVRVVRPHQVPARSPILLSVGDKVSVGARDDEWPAFVFVTTPIGGEGWVPGRLLQRDDNGGATAIGRYDTTELAADPETLLTVLETDLGSGWLWCRDPGTREGWVPVRCVEPLGKG